MPKTVKEMMDAANAVVPKITVAEARALLAKGDAVIVDVRDSAAQHPTSRAGNQVPFQGAARTATAATGRA